MSKPCTAALLLALTASCATATQGELGESPAGSVDAGSDPIPNPGDPDADVVDLPEDTFDAAPPLAFAAPHIVLSEVALAPTGGEFVEIFNGTDDVVNLDTVYLSDATEYHLLAGLTGAGPPPSMGSFDFIAGFPAGASIEVGEAITVAMDGDGFETSYGSKPDYCLTGSACTTVEVVAGTPSSTLTNSGEPISLFEWDGMDDLVTDLDLVLTGEPTATNPVPNKSDVPVDGPDSGSSPSSYLHDSLAMSYHSSAPGSGTSIKRISPEQGEQPNSGNGYDGHDETSEDMSASWEAPPYSAPTPGSVPQALLNP